ncbi:hypothetical protein K525DRAFT_272984 [Schizophyllum commune Loenen D]|nr:hypothetical protein K525DRAFT_272984 [Schizophyllum commune Loenen D]
MSIYVCAECRNYYEKKRQAMLQAAPGNQGHAGDVLRLFLLRQRLALPEHPIIKLFKLPLIVLSAKTHRRCTVKPTLFPPTGQIKAYATSQKVMQFKYWVVRVVTAAAPTSQKVDKNGVVPVQGLREGDPLVPAEESTRNIADRARSLMLPLLIKATYHEDSQESFFQLHHAQQLTASANTLQHASHDALDVSLACTIKSLNGDKALVGLHLAMAYMQLTLLIDAEDRLDSEWNTFAVLGNHRISDGPADLSSAGTSG